MINYRRGTNWTIYPFTQGHIVFLPILEDSIRRRNEARNPDSHPGSIPGRLLPASVLILKPDPARKPDPNSSQRSIDNDAPDLNYPGCLCPNFPSAGIYHRHPAGRWSNRHLCGNN